MTSKKTQTIDQALAAIEAAGHKVYGSGTDAKIYDPRLRKAYATIESGYCDADYDDYCDIECESRKKGGPTGEFKTILRAVLVADRQSR